jgi:hypothetical protein
VRIDRRSANPADQVTTALDRELLRDHVDAITAEQTKIAEDAETARMQHAADLAFTAAVNRLRARYLTDHPTATDAEFERDLPNLIVESRSRSEPGP